MLCAEQQPTFPKLAPETTSPLVFSHSSASPSSRTGGTIADLPLLVLGASALLIVLTLWFATAPGGPTGHGAIEGLRLRDVHRHHERSPQAELHAAVCLGGAGQRLVRRGADGRGRGGRRPVQPGLAVRLAADVADGARDGGRAVGVRGAAGAARGM